MRTAHETSEAKIRRLENTIADLKEEIRQRDAAYGPAGTFPASLGLSLAEDIALSALRTRYPGDVPAESLILRCWGSRSVATPSSVVGLITGIRRKVKGTAIEIDSLSGVGYRLTQASIGVLDQLREKARSEATQPPRLRDAPFQAVEDGLLTKAWGEGKTGQEIAALLAERGFPLRTKNQITKRADFLQLASRKAVEWKRSEDDILREGRRRKKNFKGLRSMLAQKGSNRTIGAIKKRCLDLGINPRPGHMTEAEITIVKAGFDAGKDPRGVQADLAALGYVRSLQTLEARRRLYKGVRPRPGWTPERTKILCDMLEQKRPIAEIAFKLKMTVSPIYMQARKLGYMKPVTTWTEEKLERLRQGAQNGEFLVNIAREIGENYQKAAAQSKRMGLDFSRGRQNGPRPQQHTLQHAAE